MNINEERSEQMVDIYIYVFKYKFVLSEIKYTILHIYLYNICIPLTHRYCIFAIEPRIWCLQFTTKKISKLIEKNKEFFFSKRKMIEREP